MNYKKFFISLCSIALLSAGMIVFITWALTDYTPKGVITSLCVIILKLLLYGVTTVAYLYLTYLLLLFLFKLIRKVAILSYTEMQGLYRVILKS